MDNEEVTMSLSFGFVIENECQFALWKLTQNDPFQLPL